MWFFLLSACIPPASLSAEAAALGKAGAPPVELPPVTPAPLPGSLWSEVGSRALIGMDGNARRVGDLITVRIEETASTTMAADTSASRDGSVDMGVTSLLGLDTKITNANSNMGGEISLGGQTSTSTNGTGSTSRTGSLQATITCDVQEVLPNGNLRIRGTKEVHVNGETQYITLEGVVRPRDILLDNTIQSDLIADSRVEYTGVGVIADKQRQGWATSAVNVLSPF